ncbi:MAG: hypothetical protein QJR07_01630 [Acetobacteraceae bacterium]|nr:hypothetical protein [Acetobacteraceae bacterium]
MADTTSAALADLAGQSTFHSNLVEIRPASMAASGAPGRPAAAAAEEG